MNRLFIFWILAIVITLSAAVYQRLTGPTHPKRVELKIDDNVYNLRLIRSHGGDDDCVLNFNIPDKNITGELMYKRFPVNEDWKTVELKRDGNTLSGILPHQPPAGKIEYKVIFSKNGVQLNQPDDYHVVVRFKGGVPAGIIIPHIFFMFFAMMLSNLAGILAIAGHKKMRFYSFLALIFLTVGGMIFGPLMQLYAFGELWTGFPKGMDLTDNKTLIALIFWIIAVYKNRKTQHPGWIIAAALVLLLINMIPHSMFGSELNYDTGTVVTG